jgi:hypothetical protein
MRKIAVLALALVVLALSVAPAEAARRGRVLRRGPAARLGARRVLPGAARAASFLTMQNIVSAVRGPAVFVGAAVVAPTVVAPVVRNRVRRVLPSLLFGPRVILFR